MTFYLTYEEYDQPKPKKSQVYHNYSQISKVAQKDKPLAISRMPTQKDDSTDLRPTPKISVNFDLYNQKPRNQ